MDFLKTLLMYMAATFVVAVESTSTPSVTPVPTPAPAPSVTVAAVTETVTEEPTITPVPTVSVTPVPVPTITPNTRAYHNLATGAKGAEVRRLQERLIELGYLPEGSADGAYGRQTAAAVRRFQYYNGLTQDGIAGRTTQTNLFENPDAAPYPQETASPEPTETAETEEAAEGSDVPAGDAPGTETTGASDGAAEEKIPEIALTSAEADLTEKEPQDAAAGTGKALSSETAANTEPLSAGTEDVEETAEAADETDGAEKSLSAGTEDAKEAAEATDETAGAEEPTIAGTEDAEETAEAGDDEEAEAAESSDGQTKETQPFQIHVTSLTVLPSAEEKTDTEKKEELPAETTEPTGAETAELKDEEAEQTAAEAGETASEEEAPAAKETDSQEAGEVENIDLDEAEKQPDVSDEPEENAYADLAGWIVLNDSGEAMQWTELEDGVPVVRSARLQRREEDQDIRISLDDVVRSVEGWILTDEGDSLVLEAQGYTLALLNEHDGFVAMVDGTEMNAWTEDFSFDEGHYIRAEFLTKALEGEWIWDEEEDTLMLRIPPKNAYQD